MNTSDNHSDKPPFMNFYNNMSTFNDSMFMKSNTDIGNIIQIPLFILLTILASSYIILVLCRKTLRSNKFNWLTINVFFACIFFAFNQVFSSFIGLNNVLDSSISCRTKGFLINMSTCHMMYTHCIATFCRLLTVKYPHKILFRSRYWLLSCIGMSWIIGLLIGLPYLFYDGFTCSSDDGKRFLRIYSSLSTILMPVIIVMICNISIFRLVRQSSKRIRDLTNNDNINQFSKRDMYLCKIILITFSLFVIGWTPLFVEQLFLADHTYIPSGVGILFRLLPPASLLADVILLIYSDVPVRKLLIQIFICHKIIPCWIKS